MRKLKVGDIIAWTYKRQEYGFEINIGEITETAADREGDPVYGYQIMFEPDLPRMGRIEYESPSYMAILYMLGDTAERDAKYVMELLDGRRAVIKKVFGPF
jgi:hypothetical protein